MKKYDEANPLNDVAAFHETFEMPIVEDPSIPSKERCALRISLLQEELNELKEAIENDDLVECADAFADIQYVLSGAILEFGLASKFKALFDEVQRSNMSKTCKSREVAIKTQEHYKATKEVDSIIEEKNGEYLVFRVPDRKVLKSVNYSPADIAGKLEG